MEGELGLHLPPMQLSKHTAAPAPYSSPFLFPILTLARLPRNRTLSFRPLEDVAGACGGTRSAWPLPED